MPKPTLDLFRIPCLVLLTLVLACPGLQAAKKNEPVTYNFTIKVEDVPRYLNNEDLRQWRQIDREIQLAEADIETGKWLEAKEYSAFVSKSKIDADRKKGKEMIADANTRLVTLTEQQNQLRLKAEEMLKEHNAQFETQQVEMHVDSLPLDKALKEPTEAMLYKLWNENYTKIFYGGTYVFDNGYYSKAAALSEDMMNTIARLDGNRYTLEEDTTDFDLEYKNGKPFINFEDRDNMVSRFKPVLIIGEVLYDGESTTGLYALHAMDIKSGRLVEQIIVTYPITDQSDAILGLSDNNAAEPASTEVDATAEANAKEADDAPKAAETAQPTNDEVDNKGLKLVLVDSKNFLGRLGDARGQYVFDISYIGQIDGYDQRAAILLNKALMREQGLKVDDMEFITLALKPESTDEEPADFTNAVWRVAPTSPVDFGKGTYAVQAQAEQNDQTVTVDIGQLSIMAVDPSTIPPQAANQ